MRQKSRTVLSVDSNGRAREYLLNYTVLFTVTIKSTTALKAKNIEQSISISRSLLFDPDAVLAVTNESEILYKDMQRDAAQLILLKMQAHSKNSAAADKVNNIQESSSDTAAMNVRPDQLPSMLAARYILFIWSVVMSLYSKWNRWILIRSFLRDENFTERQVLDVDAQFDWQNLMDEAASMSLFASRRIVELRLPSAKPGRQGSQVLKDYLTQPPEDTVLLVNAGKIDGNAKKSAWFKAIEQKGLVVQCWPVPVEKLSFLVKAAIY